MIESSKYNRENYPRKCFWTQEKETRVNKRLSAFEQLGTGGKLFLNHLWQIQNKQIRILQVIIHNYEQITMDTPKLWKLIATLNSFTFI